MVYVGYRHACSRVRDGADHVRTIDKYKYLPFFVFDSTYHPHPPFLSPIPVLKTMAQQVKGKTAIVTGAGSGTSPHLSAFPPATPS